MSTSVRAFGIGLTDRSVRPPGCGRPPGCRPVRHDKRTAGTSSDDGHTRGILARRRVDGQRRRNRPHKRTLTVTVVHGRGGIVGGEHCPATGTARWTRGRARSGRSRAGGSRTRRVGGATPRCSRVAATTMSAMSARRAHRAAIARVSVASLTSWTPSGSRARRVAHRSFGTATPRERLASLDSETVVSVVSTGINRCARSVLAELGASPNHGIRGAVQ